MYKYLLLITSLVVIAFTSAVSIPGSPYLIGGMTQADISNMFPTAITPAGITFAIWSIIYLSWILAWLILCGFPFIWIIKKYFPKISYHLIDHNTSRKPIIAFSLAIIFTAIWLIPWWNIWIGTALLLMFLILGLLKYSFYNTRNASFFIRSSIELTLGWINIATVANIAIWLVSIGFTGGWISEIYWVVGVLGLALLLTAYYQCQYRAYIVSLVFIWTMLGEWIAHPSWEQRFVVALFALIAATNMLCSFLRKR